MLKALGLAALLGTVVTTQLQATDTKVDFTPAQEAKIKDLMGIYIKENPKALIETLQKFTKEQEEAAIKKVQDAVTASKDQLSDSSNAIVIGNSKAPVNLVVFVDPNCPHCHIVKSVIDEIEKELPEKDKLGILIRQWPILGEKSEAVSAGLLAAYAQDPKKFTALSEKLLKSEKAMDKESFMGAAKEAGFDPVKLEASMKSDAVMSQLKNTKELAAKIGLEATPTLILTDKKGAQLLQVGSKEALKELLTKAIKES